MKRFPLLLSAVVALSAMTAPGAHAAPDPGAGAKPAELLRYTGDASSATGNAVSNGRCDVDGDGRDDLVVGAWFWDKTPTNNIGAAYVLLGDDAVQSASLSDPAAANAVRIDGPTDDPRSIGFSVGCLGDVNGDGFDDIGIGDYQDNRAVVVFGAETFTGLSLDSLGDRGFVVRQDYTGTADRENLSYSLAAVGDIDDDGMDDFAMAGIVADTQGRTNNGRVWVISGRDDIADINLDAPGPKDVLLTVDGAISEERLGQVARAGDVNGDGIDDLVLGAYTSTPWGPGVAVPGVAYVVLGGTTGQVDAASLGDKGFTVYGPKRGRDRLGVSVSAAGDLDGDGKDDLLIGADGVSNQARNGGAAVVRGSASTATVYTDPTTANGQSVFTCPAEQTPGECATPTARGYWINGATLNDSAGYSVAGIGDVDGDGVPDLAIGAYGFDPVNPENTATTMSGAGAAYVVRGRASGTGVQQLASLTEDQGYRIDGLKAGDRLGRQVGLIGDFDGNGVRDLVAAADFASRPGTQNGELVVALMGRLTTTTTLSGPARVLPGQDATFTATVAKAAGSRTPLAEGSVSFELAGAAIDGCTDVPVTDGTATCDRAGSAEVSGDVTASFSGTTRLQGAQASALPFAVARTATTTAIEVSAADPRPGQLVQVRATVLDEQGEPVTTGTVRFESAGAAVTGCREVAVVAGDAVCTTSWPTRGERDVTATYSGTATVAGSTSGATTVSVGVDAVVKPDAVPSFTYGTKASALTGEVRGDDTVPTGTVEVREGSTLLATTTLSSGEYAVRLGATALTPGAHTLTLAYAGDERTRAAERNVAVTVARATSTVGFSRSRSTLKGSQRLTVGITVKARGVTPTGRAQVKVGSTVVKTVTLRSGAARYTLAKLAKGSQKVSVTYLGSSTVSGGRSVTKVVKQK